MSNQTLDLSPRIFMILGSTWNTTLGQPTTMYTVLVFLFREERTFKLKCEYQLKLTFLKVYILEVSLDL